MRRPHLVAVACLAPLVLTGCQTESPPSAPELRIVRRLMDEGFRTASPPFTRRGYTAIGDTSRLAVAAADPVDLNVSCVPARQSTSVRRPCALSVPREVAPVQTLIVETAPLQLIRADAKSIPR